MVSFECACRASDLGCVGQLPGYCLAVLAENDCYPDNYHCFVVPVCRTDSDIMLCCRVTRIITGIISLLYRCVGMTRTSCYVAVLNYSGYCGVALQVVTVVPGI